MAPVSRLSRDERGMALGLALFALAFIGGMVAVSFYPAVLEQQAGRNLLLATEAAESAEAGLGETLEELTPEALLPLAIGGPALILGSLSPQPGLLVVRQVLRLADNLYLLQCRAAWQDGVGGESAARSAGLLAQLVSDSTSSDGYLSPIERRPWVQLY